MGNLEGVQKRFPSLTEGDILRIIERAKRSAERMRAYNVRKRIITNIYIEKARAAGIKVTREELERELKKRG